VSESLAGLSIQAPLVVSLPRTLAFGVGVFERFLDQLASGAASRIFILTAPPTLRHAEAVASRAGTAGKRVEIWSDIVAEPSVRTFAAAADSASKLAPDLVIGLGGGSVLDVAKLVAALWQSPSEIDASFGIGKLAGRTTRLACIPTTAGTGSEVSPNAILLDERENLKKGVISPHLMPDESWCDPALTLTVPASVTAAVGMDALVHCIEAYANRFSHPMIDAWAIEGVRLIASSLKQAVLKGDDLDARSRVMLGALYGGMCLGPVNTGAVHALAYPLGSEFKIAHGVSNSVLLTQVLAFNLPAATRKYADIAVAMGVERGASDAQTAERGLAHLKRLSKEVGIPQSLAEVNIPRDALHRMASAAMTVTRLLDRNPRTVTLEDAIRIYQQAYSC
jgi:alcohol dehydrogenase